jgi:uncharacterized protein (TIGR00725 family)
VRKPIIGVMGPGAGATSADLANARALGGLVAGASWTLLTGGQAVGVMDAASKGAAEAGGTVVGVLPQDDDASASDGVSIAVVTGMGNARNAVNVLSSDVVVACGMGLGTASEVALALKSDKPVVLLGCCEAAEGFFAALAPGRFQVAADPEAAVALCRAALGG